MTDLISGKSALGGAANETGGEYRRALAALFVAHALNGAVFEGLPFGGADAVVTSVALEVDAPVDDILVGFSRGRLYLQAKRTLKFGRPLREVGQQWLRAVRSESFQDGEFIGVGSGSISRPLRLAAKALERRRADANAAWTNGERVEVENLRTLLLDIGASDEEALLVLSRAVFLEKRVEEESESDAQNGRLLLDGHVVLKGEGGRAWRELVSIAGSAARHRIGYTAPGWLEELRRRNVPLTSEAERSAAAALEQQHQAVERYRDRLSKVGSMVDLTAAGAKLPPLPLVEMDALVTVRDPHDAKERDRSKLLWAFHRRGRVILTGLPGGGKSTCLRSAAGAWAQRSKWAIPIVVSLRRLAEDDMFRRRSLRDGLLDLAIEATPLSDREFLREALDCALDEGDAVLFLDGLDEAADRSLDLASDISNLLHGDVHPDTDVLLATRDAAYSHAQILRFSTLVLNPPDEPRRPVRAVIAAIAEQRDIKNERSWVEQRVQWVDDVLKQDSQLSETPLLPILLALLAGENDTDTLPSTRAQILSTVVRNIVERHEIKREHALAALPKGHEAKALLGAFPRIASALAAAEGTVPRRGLVESVVPYLIGEWGLAPEPALQTAEEILRFWDESGVFVAHGPDKKTSPRIQLFLEIGAALDAASGQSGDPATFVAQSAPRVDRHETLILAAGLSENIADALIAYATEHDDETLTLAAGTALAQGGSSGDAQLQTLVEHLIRLMQPGDDVAWQVFNTMMRIPMPSDLQKRILVALDCFDRGRETVGRALAALEWDCPTENRNDLLEAGLRVGSLPKLSHRYPSEGSIRLLVLASVDQAFMRVKIGAASVLLPERPELAHVVVDAMEHASVWAVEALSEILRRNGHNELSDAVFREWMSSDAHQRFTRHAAKWQNEVKRTLETILALAPPAVLTRPQARRRELLASFLETMDLNDMSAWNPDIPETMREHWYHLVAALGDFDVAVLAAQAQLVLEETTEGDHAAFYSLFDEAEGVSLDHWESIHDANEGREIAVHLLAGGQALALVCGSALSTHPDEEQTAQLVEARLPAVPRRSKWPAVWVAVNLSEDPVGTADRIANSSEAGDREAVARIAPMSEGGKPTHLGRTLVRDEDREVQLETIASFGRDVQEPEPELVSLLEQTAQLSPKSFVCGHCGTENEGSSDSCISCSIVTRRPCDEAQNLLARYKDMRTDDASMEREL